VADSYHYGEELEPDQHFSKSWIRIRVELKSWIWIRIKVMQIRNPAIS
jgi:hypothetical protein